MKVSDWFPADTKPVRDGVYKRKMPLNSKAVYSHWNGRFWGYSSASINTASLYSGVRSSYTSLPWKGLVKS